MMKRFGYCTSAEKSQIKKSVTRIPGCTDVRQVGVDEGSAPAKQSPIAAPMLQPELGALQPYKNVYK